MKHTGYFHLNFTVIAKRNEGAIASFFPRKSISLSFIGKPYVILRDGMAKYKSITNDKADRNAGNEHNMN